MNRTIAVLLLGCDRSRRCDLARAREMPRLPLESCASFLWEIEGHTTRADMAGACSYSVILTDQSLRDAFCAPELQIEDGKDGLQGYGLDQMNSDANAASALCL